MVHVTITVTRNYDVQIHNHHMKFINELLDERNKWLLTANETQTEEDEKKTLPQATESRPLECPKSKDETETLFLDIHRSKNDDLM